MKKLAVLATAIAMLSVASFPSHAAEMGEVIPSSTIPQPAYIEKPVVGGRSERIAYLGFRRHEFGLEKPLWQFIEFMIAEDSHWADNGWIYDLMAEAYPDEDLYPEPEEVETESDATESAAEETPANEQEKSSVATEPEAESKQEEVSTATEPEAESKQEEASTTTEPKPETEQPENNTQTAAEANRSVILNPIVINNDQTIESVHYIDRIGNFSQIAQHRRTLVREVNYAIRELYTQLKAIVK